MSELYLLEETQELGSISWNMSEALPATKEQNNDFVNQCIENMYAISMNSKQNKEKFFFDLFSFVFLIFLSFIFLFFPLFSFLFFYLLSVFNVYHYSHCYHYIFHFYFQ